MNTQFLNGHGTLAQNFDKFFSSRRAKFLLFIGSFIVGMFLAWCAYASYHDMAISGLWSSWPLAIIFFPSGLPFSSTIFPLYWLVYIAIIVAGIWMKNALRSRILFFIFLLLLIVNIAGCAASPDPEITIF